MLDTRKSGLIQSCPPSLSRNELYVSAAPVETKPGVRSRDHSHVDKNALSAVVVHRENNQTVITNPIITGQPRAPSDAVAGTDIIVNGGFLTDVSWTKGTGWTIAAGLASSDATQVGDSDLTQVGATLLAPLVQGEVYTITFTVSGQTLGNVTAVVGGTEGTDRAADGTYVQDIVAGAGADIDIRADLAFDGDVTGVTVTDAAGSYNVGDTLRLSCGAVGGGTVTYQWQKDAGDIVGATSAILTIPNLDATDSGSYTCDVTNSSGTTSSVAVVITVV